MVKDLASLCLEPKPNCVVNLIKIKKLDFSIEWQIEGVTKTK